MQRQRACHPSRNCAGASREVGRRGFCCRSRSLRAHSCGRTGAQKYTNRRLERRTEGVQSRAGTVMPRVLELFEARGIADRFIRKTAEIQKNPFRPVHIYAGLRYVKMARVSSRFGFTLALPQNSTEEILAGWATSRAPRSTSGPRSLVLFNTQIMWRLNSTRMEKEGHYALGTWSARMVGAA